jgi:hypothetical protein
LFPEIYIFFFDHSRASGWNLGLLLQKQPLSSPAKNLSCLQRGKDLMIVAKRRWVALNSGLEDKPAAARAARKAKQIGE